MAKRGGISKSEFLLGLGEYLVFEGEHFDLVKETQCRGVTTPNKLSLVMSCKQNQQRPPCSLKYWQTSQYLHFAMTLFRQDTFSFNIFLQSYKCKLISFVCSRWRAEARADENGRLSSAVLTEGYKCSFVKGEGGIWRS